MMRSKLTWLQHWFRYLICWTLIFPVGGLASGPLTEAEILKAYKGWDSINYEYNEKHIDGRTVYTHSMERCRKLAAYRTLCNVRKLRSGDQGTVDVGRVTTRIIEVHDGYTTHTTSDDLIIGPKRKINLGIGMSISQPKADGSGDQLVQLKIPSEIGPGIANEILPALGVEISDQLSFHQKVRDTGRAMNAAYRSSLESQRDYISQIKASGAAVAEATELNRRNMVDNLGLISATLNASQLTNEQKTAREVARQIERDFLKFRQYDYNEVAQKRLLDQFKEELLKRSVLGVASLAEESYYQKKPIPESQSILDIAVNDDGIVMVDKIKSVPPSPLQATKFKTNRNSPYGQITRRVANRFQAEWANSNALATYTQSQKQIYSSGLVMLRTADSLMSMEDNSPGEKLLELSNILADGIHGFSDGMAASLNEIVDTVPSLYKFAGHLTREIINDPAKLGTYSYKLAAHAPEIIDGFVSYVNSLWHTASEGNSYERGELLGRITTDYLIGVATGGVLKTVQLAAKGTTRIAKSTKAWKTLSKATRRHMGSYDYNRIGKGTVSKAVTSVQKDFIAGTQKIMTSSPIQALNLIKYQRKLRAKSNFAASDFIERLGAASPEYLTKTLTTKKIVDQYLDFQKRFKKIKLTSESMEVWRAIPKEITIDGKKIHLKEGDVFKVHPSMRTNHHRYTMGGPLGQKGVYASGGPTVGAWETVIKEARIGDDVSEFWLANKQLKSKKVLDLTDNRTLQQLKLSSGDLKILGSASKYNLPQMIGDIARKAGVEVIKSPSARSKGGINYVILSDKILN